MPLPQENFNAGTYLIMKRWACRRVVSKDLLQVSAPVAAGFLTNGAMTGALTSIQDTMNAHEQARVDYIADKASMSFTEKYGPDLAAMVHRILLVDDDAAMTAVHGALARNKQSSRDSAIISAALLKARAVCQLPVADGTAPKVTKTLVDMFRSHEIHSNGVVFGEGMTVFNVVCMGHPNERDARRRLDEANMVESGGSLSLQDARALSVTDARMPQMITHAVDKLYGDVIIKWAYFGPVHPLVVASRDAVLVLGPALHNLASYYGSPAEAVNMVNRILFNYQQITFRWLRSRRDTPRGTDVPVPNFTDLAIDVQSFLLSGIPDVPADWQRMIREENNRAPATPEDAGPSRLRGGGDTESTNVTNSLVDRGIKRRWEQAGFTLMADMTGAYTGEGSAASATPKLSGGAAICLKWSCTGKCNSRCKRKAAHKKLGPQLIIELNEFMDSCGVARP
jgi:hypothetical protein